MRRLAPSSANPIVHSKVGYTGASRTVSKGTKSTLMTHNGQTVAARLGRQNRNVIARDRVAY